MRYRLVFILLAGMIVASSSAGARMIAFPPLPGVSNPIAIAGSGEYLYVSAKSWDNNKNIETVLYIYNISDPGSSVDFITMRFDGKPAALYVSEHRLYVLTWDGDGLWRSELRPVHLYLTILDVTEPDQPVELGRGGFRFVFDGRTHMSIPHVWDAMPGLTVSGNRVFLFLHKSGIVELDASDPEQIRKVSESCGMDAHRGDVWKDYLIVSAGGQLKLHIPEGNEPCSIGRNDFEESFSDGISADEILVKGDYFFVDFTLFSEIDPYFHVHRLTVGQMGVEEIHSGIEEEGHPEYGLDFVTTLMDETLEFGCIAGMAVKGPYLFVRDIRSFKVINISKLPCWRLEQTVDLSSGQWLVGEGRGVYISGSRAWVTGYEGVFSIDISDYNSD